MDKITQVFTAIPFSSATWIVLAILMFVVWIFSRSNKDPKSPLQWEHLIIDSQNDRASPYKLGYLVGVIVSTWLVITLTDSGKVTYDIVLIYLAFLLGGAGWSSFVKSKETH